MDTNSFFQDLAVILVAVGTVSALFTRLGWPKVIGYILAGMLVGEYTFGGSLVVNQGSIDVLGQIGVVFLMFAMGLEFSVRKLRKVGHVIFPTAVFDMVVMVWAGHFVGTRLLGWGSVQSLFLGAAISDSATTLLSKTISEMGWGARKFTKYIFGITITEDILCIGVIALLTGLVKTGSMSAAEVAYSMGGLLLFLTGVTIFGLLLIPRVMNWVAKLHDDEALLLTMLGFCFLVSFIAAKLNYSLALGAFLVGVMGAESEPLKRIYQQCLPLRTMFSAIFFVTIGLLIDPWQMMMHWQTILGITVLVVVGKSFNCTVGSLLTGLDLKNALQTGIGLAQIGEFAYLVALIGVTMKVVDSSLYQIAVGVSVLTTVLNPFLLRASDPFSDWVKGRLPRRWKGNLETYANWIERYRHTSTTGETTRVIRFNLTLLLLQLALVAVAFIAANMLAELNYARFSMQIEANKRTLLWGLASLLTLPIAILLFFRARALGGAVADVLIPLKIRESSWAQAFRRFTGVLFSVAGLAVLFFETAMLSGTIMPEQGWAKALVGAVLLLTGLFGWRRIRRMGERSLQTLKGVLSEEMDIPPSDLPSDLLAIHTERLLVGDFEFSGRSLREIDLRARTGASVIGIERNGRMLMNPTADAILEAGDGVVLLGDEEHIARARALLTNAAMAIAQPFQER